MALVNGPRLLIADEPTTGLDVTVQAQVLDLLAGLVTTRNMATIIITHDLGVVSHYCTRIAVMFAGTVVYVYTGTQLAQITSLKGILSPGLLLAFVLLLREPMTHATARTIRLPTIFMMFFEMKSIAIYASSCAVLACIPNNELPMSLHPVNGP